MKKTILFIMALFCIFFYNCKNKNTDKQQIVAVSNDKESISRDEPQKKFDPIQPSKVITYREIELYLEYIKKSIEESNQYFITERNVMNELFSRVSDYFQNMLSSELRLLRNEFFARKGYIFKSSDLNEYFSKQSWYNPLYTSMDSVIISKEYQQIVDSILFYEQKNTALTNEILKNNMLQLLKNSEWERSWSGCYETDFSTALFRRNIGYLLIDKRDVDKDEERIYMHYNRLLLIDTIGANKDILVMGYIRQVDCPAEYCLYGGVLFTCDVNFKSLINSRPFIFNTFLKKRQKTSLLCSLGTPIDYGGETTSILIDSNGKITDYIEDSLQ